MGDFIQPNSTDGDRLFGYKLSGQYLPFCITTIGIFVCYCLSSVSQEYLFYAGFNSTSFLTLCAKGFAVLWGIAGGGLSSRKATHSSHAMIGILSFATMYLSNQSLLTLNYPTQTLFKSAKLIPVMIGAIVINRKKFHMLEYAGAACLLIGLVSFTLTDVKVAPNFELTGVVLVSSALICDALIGNLQEKQFSQYGAGANEMMTYSNAWAGALSVVGCMIEGSDSTLDAIAFLRRDPTAILCIFLYCLLNILGIYFVLVMITMFGATVTAFTTSLRKALSIILSFIVYTKPFAWGYVIGGIVTAAGIACNIQASRLKRQAASSSTVLPLSLSKSDTTPSAARSFGDELLVELRPLVTARSVSDLDGSPGLPTTPHLHHAPHAASLTGDTALDTNRLIDTLAVRTRSSPRLRQEEEEEDPLEGNNDRNEPTPTGPSNSPHSITASIYTPATIRKSNSTLNANALP